MFPDSDDRPVGEHQRLVYAFDPDIRRWVATAYHYLGRIAEVNRRYKTALSLYLQGQAIQDECPEELQALAFLHVRIAEPLTAVGLFEAARDHLNLALELFQLSAKGVWPHGACFSLCLEFRIALPKRERGLGSRYPHQAHY
jgi:tetratricopeptide (TPR) repeat protein